MIDLAYREARIIRPHTEDAIRIEVTCKCDSMSEIVGVAKYTHRSKESIYAVCDGVLYFLDGRNDKGYLVNRVVNV